MDRTNVAPDSRLPKKFQGFSCSEMCLAFFLFGASIQRKCHSYIIYMITSMISHTFIICPTCMIIQNSVDGRLNYFAEQLTLQLLLLTSLYFEFYFPISLEKKFKIQTISQKIVLQTINRLRFSRILSSINRLCHTMVANSRLYLVNCIIFYFLQILTLLNILYYWLQFSHFSSESYLYFFIVIYYSFREVENILSDKVMI